MVWLSMSSCPSKDEGSPAAAPASWWQSRGSTRYGFVQSCAGCFPATCPPHWNRGYSRSAHIPGPRGSVRLCLHPCTSTTAGTALHRAQPRIAASTTFWPAAGPLLCSHSEMFKKASSGRAFIGSLCTQQGHHLGPPLPQGVRAAFLFVFSLGGGEE